MAGGQAGKNLASAVIVLMSVSSLQLQNIIARHTSVIHIGQRHSDTLDLCTDVCTCVRWCSTEKKIVMRNNRLKNESSESHILIHVSLKDVENCIFLFPAMKMAILTRQYFNE